MLRSSAKKWLLVASENPWHREPLTAEMISHAQLSGLKFMDRDGEKYGVQLISPSLFQASPMMEMAGREVLVMGTSATEKVLWHLRLQAFYKETPEGLLFYYVPIPKELEIPPAWKGE